MQQSDVTLAGEKEYGHLSLKEAEQMESTECADIEYTLWIRSEINEWVAVFETHS